MATSDDGDAHTASGSAMTMTMSLLIVSRFTAASTCWRDFSAPPANYVARDRSGTLGYAGLFSKRGLLMKRLLMIVLAVGALCVGQVAGLDAQAKPKAMTANGTVKAVSGNSLTVTAAGKDMMFTLDGSTKFVGKGLGTKAKSGPVTAADAVAMGDHVKVTYHDMGGGTMHAANVTVTAKAAPAKK